MHVQRSSAMNTHSPLPFLALAAMLFSCGHAAPSNGTAADATAGVVRVVREVAITGGSPVTTADLGIEGMSCEMMCGGSIKKALAKLPGVTVAEIRFDEGAERDHAIVTYDDSQVTDAQMIEAVHKLHGGQYKVVSITITKQVMAAGDASEREDAAGNREAAGVYAPPASALLPSVLTLLTWILRT